MCIVEGFGGKHSISVFKRRRSFDTVYHHWLSVGLCIEGLLLLVVCIVEGFGWKHLLSFFKMRRCLEIVYIHWLSVGRQLKASKRRMWRKHKVLIILSKRRRWRKHKVRVILSKRRRWRKHKILVIRTIKSLRVAKCPRISQHGGILCTAAMRNRRIRSYPL